VTLRRLAPVALVAASLTACAPSYHDAYRAAHPGWSAGAFPHGGAGLEETLAALDAPPDAQERTTLQRIRIVNATGARWEEVSVAAVESGAYRPSPLHAYLVLAQVACSATTADAWISNDDVAWYLILEGGLAGHRHVVYDRVCHGDVRTARPPVDVTAHRCLRDYARRSKAMAELDLEETCGPIVRLRAGGAP
jgi:hypothetical protein